MKFVYQLEKTLKILVTIIMSTQKMRGMSLDKKCRTLSKSFCWTWYCFGWRQIWKFQRNLYKNVWSRSCTFFLVPGLAWIAKLKMTEVESELLTNMDMVLTVDNFDQESEVEYVVLFFVMQKQITNIWSATMKTKNVHTLTKVICMDIQ